VAAVYLALAYVVLPALWSHHEHEPCLASLPMVTRTSSGIPGDAVNVGGKYAWASGPSLPRYVFAAFLKRNDLVMNFVSYRDASQPQADLGEGRIQVLVTSLTASSSPVQSGKAHFLAVINPTRAAALPELQTARELGHPELEIDGLAGIFAGTIMSAELRNRIAADVAAVCQEPEARRKLEAAGHNVLGGTTGELKAGIAKQRAWLNEVTRIIDVKNAQ
jgi:tripartite-type tricarboxylate transporter receptor subunit TctC